MSIGFDVVLDPTDAHFKDEKKGVLCLWYCVLQMKILQVWNNLR